MLTISRRCLPNYGKRNKLCIWLVKSIERKFHRMDQEISNAVKARLEKSKSVIIASHVRPDGDAIGSLLGLGLALQNSEKSVQMVLVDGVPSSYKHLEGSEFI